MELISVIIPAFNAEGFIFKAVNSLINQTYKNIEIIIISDDLTNYKKHLEGCGISDDRIKQYYTGKVGIGPSAARNIGLRMCSGRVIALLDADDQFIPERLEQTYIKALEHGLVTCAVDIRDNNNNNIKTCGQNFYGAYSFTEYPKINFSTHSMIVFNKDALPFYYDETLSHAEDLEFIIQAAQKLSYFFHISEPMYIYFKNNGSLSNSNNSSEKFISTKKELLKRINNKKYKLPEDISYSFRALLEKSLFIENQILNDKSLLDSRLFEDLIN